MVDGFSLACFSEKIFRPVFGDLAGSILGAGGGGFEFCS